MNDRISLAPERSGRIYIAGPMTGLPDFNFPAFNDMAAILRGLGYHVENPAEHGVVDGAEWADYLRYDIARLATCEALVLLPGWPWSRGALLEVHIAKALGHAFQGTVIDGLDARLTREPFSLLPASCGLFCACAAGQSIAAVNRCGRPDSRNQSAPVWANGLTG